ncbi:hypothetical protein NBO_1051g0001 [Nosema bombycis CQ1]|uniref:Uncharacterized protein n=1 Tax=Nosema bombycis (strain CQ1 / CVCC 102059) TaxID=578461 RepID=R0M0M2_NOSB1|nr:hypothetical protein NBO_1051g0001 [Nosema bombycis CQ1]|eukprot:EOB11574.1 hypothetical protein NBO_1051g0001 [Nosema bombycis CQ1]
MILQKIFIYLITVCASLHNKNRKRQYESHINNQSVKISRTNEEEKPLDLSFKKNFEEPENNPSASFHHTNPPFLSSLSSCYSINAEFIKRIYITFDNLLFDMLRVLNSIYIISGVKPISLNLCCKLREHGKIKRQIEKYILDFENNDKIALYRNSNINFYFEKHFQNNRIGVSDWNIENYIDNVYMDLRNGLKNESIPSLFNSLLIAVKDFGPDKFTGFISLVLFLFSSDANELSEFKELLMYSIVFFRCMMLQECQKNIDAKVLNSWELKSKLYKMILKCFYPSTYTTEYENIFNLLNNIYSQNKMVNEPQVFLFLYFSNIKSIPEFLYIFRNLNDADNTTDKMMIDLSKEFRDYMSVFYKIENILMENSFILY